MHDDLIHITSEFSIDITVFIWPSMEFHVLNLQENDLVQFAGVC